MTVDLLIASPETDFTIPPAATFEDGVRGISLAPTKTESFLRVWVRAVVFDDATGDGEPDDVSFVLE
ncbi:MAG TPA: hypothetical protein VFV34_24400, partial [Blastocatellia bacterium]|nr:hypothetical protein [Blastocatellia bacterium]